VYSKPRLNCNICGVSSYYNVHKQTKTMSKQEEFKKEFKALLEKYDAEISVELDGDTHGLYDALVVELKDKEVMRFDNPSSVSHYDIK